jgi:hypothetical protein
VLAALRTIKENCSLYHDTIRKIPLLDEVLNYFDNLHKQLRTKQKSYEIKVKKQRIFYFEQIVSEDEEEKVYNVLLSIKRKLNSDESKIP